MEETPQFEAPCLYRQAGAFCEKGYLHHAVSEANLDGQQVHYAVTVGQGADREMVQCPACEGTGKILTPLGKAALRFLTPHIAAVIHETLGRQQS